MLRRGNPYTYLAAAVVLALVAVAVDDSTVRALLGLLGVAASVVAVVLLARRSRDPNGPPGQH